MLSQLLCPWDPELPAQQEMFLVPHRWQDLPRTLVSALWELAKLFCNRQPVSDLGWPDSWLCSALGFALEASQRQRGKVGYFCIVIQLKSRPNKVRNHVHKWYKLVPFPLFFPCSVQELFGFMCPELVHVSNTAWLKSPWALCLSCSTAGWWLPLSPSGSAYRATWDNDNFSLMPSWCKGNAAGHFSLQPI